MPRCPSSRSVGKKALAAAYMHHVSLPLDNGFGSPNSAVTSTTPLKRGTKTKPFWRRYSVERPPWRRNVFAVPAIVLTHRRCVSAGVPSDWYENRTGPAPALRTSSSAFCHSTVFATSARRSMLRSSSRVGICVARPCDRNISTTDMASDARPRCGGGVRVEAGRAGSRAWHA